VFDPLRARLNSAATTLQHFGHLVDF
jgi:hypothetical protein